MQAIRTALLVVGIACMATLFLVIQTRKTDADGAVVETVTQIGFPPSPWYHYREGKDGFKMETNFLTVSTLFGLAGVFAFWGFARLHQREHSPG